jgi:DNA (cytosine-5)-methyltransferase 1
MRPSLSSVRTSLRAIDLFCGAGGLTAGFEAAGYEVTFALDRDRDSCETYHLNHPTVDVEQGSIVDLSPTEIARRSGTHIDVVLGGPSCQGFSTHGRRNGWVRENDERNELWLHMLKVVQHLKPRAFLMENVPGLVYWREGAFGETILDEFRRIGYSVSKQIILAADHGIPQRRRRLFIVGLRGKADFNFPKETHLGGWRRDALRKWELMRRERGLLHHVPVWDAIADLPPLNGTLGMLEMPYPGMRLTPYARAMRAGSSILRDHEVVAISDDHVELVRYVPQGGTWRDIPPHLLPDRYRGMRRTDSTNLLGRLDPGLPAYTITTQFGNVTTGCFTHPYEDRPLSVREGARIQSFPDRYKFTGSITSRFRQIGNAVPPMLARILAEELAVQLGYGESRSRSIRRAAQIPPAPPTDITRARMKAQKTSGTSPECQLREKFDELGLSYELHARPMLKLRRSADFVFADAKVAVFVDGCFWHGCPTHTRSTKSNTKWWAEKIQRNKERDADTNRRLRAGGWLIVRVWEHEPPVEAGVRIAGVVKERTSSRRAARGAGARSSALSSV